MSEWVHTTLGEIASFQNGYPFKPAELTGRGAPVVRIKQLLDPSAETDHSDVSVPSKFWIEDGDLIFSWSGTLASVMWRRGRAILNQHLFKVSASDGIDLGWLYYALDGAVADLNQKTHGTTMKHVTKRTLEGHHVQVPPLLEQRRIVDVMAAVDGQIEALTEETRSGEATYSNATSLLWLNEDGIEATALPLRNVMALDVERRRLDDAATYRSAGVLNAGKGVIDKGSFLGRETEYDAMNVLREGQIVMRKLTAWEGPITVVPLGFDGFVASNEFPTFTLNNAVSPAWMKHVCRTPRLWEEMKNRVTGTVQRRKRLNPDQLLEVALPIPPREVQERVADALDALDQEVANLTDELKHLRSFRSALLTALLNQEIEIPESCDGPLGLTAVGVA